MLPKVETEWCMCACVIHLGTFLSRPLQNNNVKLPNSAFCGERNQDGEFPCFSSDISYACVEAR